MGTKYYGLHAWYKYHEQLLAESSNDRHNDKRWCHAVGYTSIDYLRLHSPAWNLNGTRRIK